MVIDFRELDALRRFLAGINARQIPSLKRYHDAMSNGFYHRHDFRQEGKLSKSSTATCVLSLIATGKWRDGPWASRSEDLAKAMLDTEWRSAGLPTDNVFTVGFILEAATVLERFSQNLSNQSKYSGLMSKAEGILQESIKGGGAQVQDYPPSSYLTQLVVRVLLRRSALPPQAAETVKEWAWREIEHQIALLIASSKTADLFQLAYSIILVASLDDPGQVTPDQSLILQTAIDQLFHGQLEDGSWPRSRPLFHYPGVGSAHCYEYEMLVQLLKQPQLEEKLLRHLPKLSRAAYALQETAYKLTEDGLGWSSGHHPQFKGPESWSTASVFHFTHILDRLIAEAIRRSIFEYLDAAYSPPKDPRTSPVEFAASFLDCETKIGTISVSLRTIIYERFVQPIAREAHQIKFGGSLSPGTPVSAIFFGPPGTSKTELTKHIADYLRWPRLIVDPSHFVRNGLDRVQAEADRLFGMLAVAEGIVVLLDEFDEMVRDRTQATEVLSRFLTTAMLPKLATINKNRRIIFIIATNYIDNFDLAISRHGRFDIILQIMPPTANEKLQRWDDVAAKLEELKIAVVEQIKEKIDALTYDEFRVLAPSLVAAPDREKAIELLSKAYEACTLKAVIDPQDPDKKSWLDLSIQQQNRIRTP